MEQQKLWIRWRRITLGVEGTAARPPEVCAVWHPRGFRLQQAVVVEVVPSEQACCLAEAQVHVRVCVRLLPF